MVHTKWKFMVNLSADYKFMEILKFAEYILCLIILFVLKLINHKISVYTLACITWLFTYTSMPETKSKYYKAMVT